jgi:hemoglobin
MKLSFNPILDIVTSFYDKAVTDILIGYHFRFIENFDEHLPRIASFWQLQLTGSIDNRAQLPFNIIELHKVLRLNKGEVHRWVILFEKTLDEYIVKKVITIDQKDEWMRKVETFKIKILTLC